MEQQKMDSKKSHFNMSEDISQISIVDSSIDETVVEARSQSQSLLRDVSINSRENKNSEKMDDAEEFSEELIPPSPMPLRSVLEDLEKGAELPKISSSKNVISVTDKLLQEAQKAAREKRFSSSETESDIDEIENEDSIRDDDDNILENDDSIRNYVNKLGNEDSKGNNVDSLENENANEEQMDDSDSDNEKDSEDIEEVPSPDVDVPSPDSEEVENNDTNPMDVNESKEQESTEQEDTTEESLSTRNQLPFSKIRKIIKADAENKLIVTKEAIYVASIAAELFIANITQQSAKITHANKKKTLSLAHLKSAVAGSESFDFLEGCFQDIY